MRIAFACLLILHGAIHLLGTARAFGFAAGATLRQPISAAGGVLWFCAALLLIASGVAMLNGARWWWWLAAAGVLLSQALIASAWQDARFGSVANLIIAAPLVLLALDMRAGSFRSRYAHDRAELLARPARETPIVHEPDLAALPPLMQQYLRRVGAVGKPRVHNVQLSFDAQMRSSVDAAWMQSRAEQFESFDPPARLFHLTASRAGIPFDVLHRYVGGAATFQVRVAGLFPVVNQSGAEMTRSETVTLLNDIVVMAPAAVLDLPIRWETVGPQSVRATFTNAGHTVSAVLTFDGAGDLVGFVSNDRADHSGKEPRRFPWSTPISGYAVVDGIRVGTRGDANWIEPSGEWTYGRFTIKSIRYNVSR
jgi:hypothetical protein